MKASPVANRATFSARNHQEQEKTNQRYSVQRVHGLSALQPPTRQKFKWVTWNQATESNFLSKKNKANLIKQKKVGCKPLVVKRKLNIRQFSHYLME